MAVVSNLGAKVTCLPRAFAMKCNCPGSTSPHFYLHRLSQSCPAPVHLSHGMAMRWGWGGHPIQQELCANTCHSYSLLLSLDAFAASQCVGHLWSRP